MVNSPIKSLEDELEKLYELLNGIEQQMVAVKKMKNASLLSEGEQLKNSIFTRVTLIKNKILELKGKE